MTEEEGFLQAVIESADDDSLRLVYADWLEERTLHSPLTSAEAREIVCNGVGVALPQSARGLLAPALTADVGPEYLPATQRWELADSPLLCK